MGPVGASKAALESMSDALRVELAPWSIPVVVISPTATDTAIFAKADALAAEARSVAEPARGELYDRQIESVAAANARIRREPPNAIRLLSADGLGRRERSMCACAPVGLPGPGGGGRFVFAPVFRELLRR